MSDPLARLIQQLGKLPGVGNRTATRLAFHILRSPPSYAEQLAAAIAEVKTKLRECSRCCMLSEGELCSICRDPRRDDAILLVVALPQDVMAVERAGSYRGRYHVLHGLLSPLDGIGPEDLRIRQLLARLGEPEQKASGPIEEVILATSPNVEGDATALYLGRLIRPIGPRVTRIASGVPIGGELEYADSVTLHRAIESRREV